MARMDDLTRLKSALWTRVSRQSSQQTTRQNRVERMNSRSAESMMTHLAGSGKKPSRPNLNKLTIKISFEQSETTSNLFLRLSRS